MPAAGITCVCTDPAATSTVYHIDAIPIRAFQSWHASNRLTRLLRQIVIGIPREVCRWLIAFQMLRHVEMFIVPGTGVLTDAFGLMSWGPYNLFRWSLMARLCRCQVLFVSVGAGPITSALGRFFIKSALSCATFRSYRDSATMEYLKGIGVDTSSDRVWPDLAFSLADDDIPRDRTKVAGRLVVGIGVMHEASMYGAGRPSEASIRCISMHL